jgi:hypothetical protein
LTASLPLTRSVVCPVLYTHQVSSATLLGRVLNGLLSAGYRPTTLRAVHDAGHEVEAHTCSHPNLVRLGIRAAGG